MSCAGRLAYGLPSPKPEIVHHTSRGWSTARVAWSMPCAVSDAGRPDSTTMSTSAISRRSTSGASACLRSSVMARLPRWYASMAPGIMRVVSPVPRGSTRNTSAPRSASTPVQYAPGCARDRSSTRRCERGPSVTIGSGLHLDVAAEHGWVRVPALRRVLDEGHHLVTTEEGLVDARDSELLSRVAHEVARSDVVDLLRLPVAHGGSSRRCQSVGADSSTEG